MSIWKNIQDKAVLGRLGEEALYEAALEEFETGSRRRGLWAKAIVEAQGDQVRTEAAYLKFLVAALKDELYIASRASEIAGARIGSRTVDAALVVAPTKEDRHINARSQMKLIREGYASIETYQIVAALLGGSVTPPGYMAGKHYIIKLDDTVSRVEKFKDLRGWFINNVAPRFDT